MIPDRPRSVITGAAGGLGRAFALRLAARGATLVLSDIDEAGLAETRSMVDRGGGSASTLVVDVSKPAQVEALFAAAEERLGATDLLVNNAGVGVGGPVGKVPLSDWEWIMGINLWGVIYGCHFFLPAMKRRARGAHPQRRVDRGLRERRGDGPVQRDQGRRGRADGDAGR